MLFGCHRAIYTRHWNCFGLADAGIACTRRPSRVLVIAANMAWCFALPCATAGSLWIQRDIWNHVDRQEGKLQQQLSQQVQSNVLSMASDIAKQTLQTRHKTIHGRQWLRSSRFRVGRKYLTSFELIELFYTQVGRVNPRQSVCGVLTGASETMFQGHTARVTRLADQLAHFSVS